MALRLYVRSGSPQDTYGLCAMLPTRHDVLLAAQGAVVFEPLGPAFADASEVEGVAAAQRRARPHRLQTNSADLPLARNVQ